MRTAISDRLADAAMTVLGEHGLAGATLERIAAAAGMSRMTLHRRGVGKAEILAGLVERMVASERTELAWVLATEGDARTRLRAVLERRCKVAERYLVLLEALDAGARDAIFHDDEGMTRAELVDPLWRLLVDGAADGTLVSEDPREDATLLYNLVGHTYRHMRTGHGWSPERARDGVVRLALDGVTAR